MGRTLTIVVALPDDDGYQDERDIKEAFRPARRELARLLESELAAHAARARARGPIMGTARMADVAKLGSLLPRDVWKAGLLGPYTRGQDHGQRAGADEPGRGGAAGDPPANAGCA